MPGVYSSSQGERVIDVINRAGGLTENADETQVNFAEHVAGCDGYLYPCERRGRH